MPKLDISGAEIGSGEKITKMPNQIDPPKGEVELPTMEISKTIMALAKTRKRLEILEAQRATPKEDTQSQPTQ